jgi:uncharacterized lipoprotein YmbA
MIRIRTYACLFLSLTGLTLAFVGCAVTSSYEKKYYILEAAREGPPGTVRTNATLRVRRFNVDVAFAGKGLVYRVGEFRYETDFYHEFLVSPGVMIAERTRDWLADSGLFARVLPVGSPLEPAYALEANVTAMYGDFTNKSAPAAVMEIRFFLLSSRDAGQSVVFAQTYRAAAPLPARTADALVGALSKDLAEILTRLEADLEKVLAGKSAEPAPAAPTQKPQNSPPT